MKKIFFLYQTTYYPAWCQASSIKSVKHVAWQQRYADNVDMGCIMLRLGIALKFQTAHYLSKFTQKKTLQFVKVAGNIIANLAGVQEEILLQICLAPLTY